MYIDDEIELPELIAGGLTPLGDALRLLDSGLSRNSMLDSRSGNYRPVIILTTDGLPTDNWKDALGRINGNRWFQNAKKAAIAIDAADVHVLESIVGNKESIVYVHNPSDLAHTLVETSMLTISCPQSFIRRPKSSQDLISHLPPMSSLIPPPPSDDDLSILGDIE